MLSLSAERSWKSPGKLWRLDAFLDDRGYVRLGWHAGPNTTVNIGGRRNFSPHHFHPLYAPNRAFKFQMKHTLDAIVSAVCAIRFLILLLKTPGEADMLFGRKLSSSPVSTMKDWDAFGSFWKR